MCGIAGLIFESPAVPGPWLRSLSQNLEHRGPDDFGFLVQGENNLHVTRQAPDDVLADVALVHRRLSIIDLSPGGWQPMGTADNRYYVIFNGEIYNYIELRAELVALGHQFRSQSDTEVLLAAHAEWGPQSLTRLVGMFALAILDRRTQTLFLARDQFGIKPLYYASWRHGFVFASEISAILELPGITPSVNPPRLYDYLRFGITDHREDTLFAGIRQVPAAHYMEIPIRRPSATQTTRYWQIDLNQQTDLSFDSAASRMREHFVESVRLHLRSDVPVGAALSGGIDSSAIVAVMRQLEPTLDIHAFSYVAEDPSLSEERWIDLVGSATRATVHKIRPKPVEMVADLEQLIRMQGECFGSTSIYAQRRVFGRAKEAGIKVMLDGQGADEMLGGYSYYVAARLASLLRGQHWTEAVQFLRRASRLPGLGGAVGLWLRAMDFLVPSKFQAPLRRWVNKDLAPSWLDVKWFRQHGVEPRSFSYTTGPDVLRQSLYRTLTEVSLPGLLRYEDRNSMSYSIESRVPFLTPALVNFTVSLPERYIIAADGTTKAVFRKAMRGLVPDPVLDRKDKIGFATPEREWLSTLRPWVDRVLKSEQLLAISAIDAGAIQREWHEILNGRSTFDFRIWRCVNFVLWSQSFGVRTN